MFAIRVAAWFAIITLGTFSWPVLAEPREDKPDPAVELKKLQGTWVATYHEAAGVEFPLVPNRPHKLVIARETFKLEYVLGADDVREEGGKLKLDPSSTPKKLAWMATKGIDEGKTSLGIYDLKDDVLTICLAPPNNPRPTKFKTQDVENLFKFKRAKARK